MHHLPNPPRTEGFIDPEAVIHALRQWFWALAETEFDFTDPPRWTHDDNRQAQSYKFHLLHVKDKQGRPCVSTISLARGVTPAQIEEKIARLAHIDPLCAKALAVLTAQKLVRGSQ